MTRGDATGQSFEGKVVIVTGSSGGIGEAIARSFAAEGARLVINSRSSVAEGEAVAHSLRDAAYVRGDVSVQRDAESLVEAGLRRWGRVDVLVNNAGHAVGLPHEDLDGLTDEIWDALFAGDLLGPWRMTKAAMPALRASGDGVVLNIGSIAGVRSLYWGKSAIAYGLAKAGLNHLATLMATVFGPQVRVNTVIPGVIVSKASTGAVYPMVRETAPLARVGDPEDIGEACLLLARARYVTGQSLVVDGGLLLRR